MVLSGSSAHDLLANFIALTFEGEPGHADGLRLVYHQLRVTQISKGLRRLGASP